MRLHHAFFLAGCGVMLSACNDAPTYAPVVDISSIEPIPKTGVHQVARGETVYEVAWRYGLDYRDVASRNKIQAPYAIHTGQNIYLRGQVKPMLAPPVSAPPVAKSVAPVQRVESVAAPVLTKKRINYEPTARVSEWLWPAKGKIMRVFSATNKGINIEGVAGSPIYASAAGKVVYSGDGLRRYGNLIIIKHNSLYLSAYANNRQLLVKEGDWVKKGQKIALMGISGAKPMLHFEIRRAGKPINPSDLLGPDRGIME